MEVKPWSVDEIEYLKSRGLRRDDPIAPGLIESYRSTRLLINANNDFKKVIDSAAESLNSVVQEGIGTAVDAFSWSVTKAVFIAGGLVVGLVAVMFLIFANMINDFRADRNAGYEIAARFHMTPKELAQTLRFVDGAAHEDPDFWSWVLSDSHYFYSLWKNNKEQRCAHQASLNKLSGCFFIPPPEEPNNQ